MSYDTNLHRTFDYQLSPAPLRIIDWAPVKAVARSVFQPGQGAKEFTLVNDATSNASSVAAAYAQQENQRRVHESRESSASLSTPAATADAAAPAGPLSAIGELAASEFPGLSAASPYYTPGMNSGAAAAAGCGGGGHAELDALHVDDALPQQQQQQRQQSDTWAVTPGEPAGGAATGNATATSEALKHTVASSTETMSAVAVPATAVLVNGSGTGTPAAVMDSAQRPRTSSPLVAPPLLAKGVSQYGAAGMMYGFDAVYHKDSFGVLAGLFTGVGYHQVNTHYRQELPAAPRRTEPAKGEHGGWAGTLGTAARTSPVVVTSAVPTPRSGSTTRVAANRSSSESGPSGAVDAAVVPGAVELQAAENSAPSPPPTLQPRLEQVIASQRHGQLQVYNALQAFWYWGARRWTGVLNVRVTPLPSGDALLPVCEYVARTVMTECSLVIDDPVVYLHGFVVMLGRRARAAEELGSGHSTGTAVVGAEVQSCNELCRAGSRHPLEAVAAASLADEAIGTAITGAQHHPAEGTGHLSVPPAPGAHRDSIQSRAGRPTGGGTAAGPPGNAGVASISFSPNATPSPPDRHSPAMSSAQHKHRSPPTACTAAASDHAHNAARYGVAVPPDAAAVDNAGGAPLPEWLYWYQRCALETTDEWLWNRAASEVADDAARSATPWWKPRHIKMGVGLALRYRKPRGVNVYWGWSARVGRGMHLSGHIDVLRRMSCAVSSTFGFLDVSVRLRVNLVTLHQTALDAGVCWRPMPQVPEFAVRLATSANGTTLGVEVADVAPTLYGPVIARLSDWRSRRHHAEATEPCKGIGGSGEDCVAGSDQSSVSGGAPTGVADGSREDLVGLLPITWHYLQSTGSTITSAFTSVKGALTNTLASVSSASSGAGSSCGGGNAANTPAAQGSVSDVRRRPALLSATPTLTTPAPSPTLPVGHKLSRVVLPAGKASLRYARNAWHALADLGWLENMLSISHVNVSMGVTSEPSNRHREWSLFLIISEK
ncbi:conserved hypothetical protein [Leishmania infantum JPCM5]|uniref:Uncharacterized protein n=2 Tax=Leishmania infantum TaxID=5671 RepID=A4HX27_LEIIN|nr:conserved hypothetical protein [Leishmania infantum JPCM5]CAC9476077.1 hypothetical_protein_-_conserved [Leishmania infantum]CAM67014.2 conserved hypothetical protein [Leishmania infantum JPCM5]SUZ40715.1 hypothetical_protein_-_conserved [Leishmania infantum]|eukprot:XP_001464618.2 conserved hypothetical protein [Leishmania infantum JPCM5]